MCPISKIQKSAKSRHPNIQLNNPFQEMLASIKDPGKSDSDTHGG